MTFLSCFACVLVRLSVQSCGCVVQEAEPRLTRANLEFVILVGSSRGGLPRKAQHWSVCVFAQLLLK